MEDAKNQIKKRQHELSVTERYHPQYHKFIKKISGVYISDEAFNCSLSTPNSPHPTKITYKNGSTYKGEVRFSVRNGEGKMTFSNQESYQGQWFAGIKHGYGTYVWPNGNTYQGDWKLNMMWGNGCMTLGNGSILSGEFWKNRLLKGNYTCGESQITIQIFDDHPQNSSQS